VDNNSDEETQEFLSEIEGEVKVIRNKENLFWSEAANKGVDAADKMSKYYLFLHHDVVILHPSWIDLLINVSEAQNAGLVGVELQSYYMQNQKVDFIQEYCMLVSKDAWSEIGPWPEELPLIGPAFIMTVRAQNNGLSPQVMRNPVVHHYKNFSVDINEYERISEQAMVAIPSLLRDSQELSRRV
jgi:GT2 family glycosyltransferase